MNHKVELTSDKKMFLLQNFPFQTGITTKAFGDFNASNENEKQLELQDFLGAEKFVRLRHQHGKQVVVLKDGDNIKESYLGDALIMCPQKRRSLAVFSSSADCPTIVLASPSSNFLGIIHSGWRGTYQNIVREAISLAKWNFKQEVKNLQAFLWPGICKSCYEFGKEMKDYFPGRIDKGHLDLKALIKEQLLKEGIREENIFSTDLCSKHSRYGGDYFFASYRRDKDDNRSMVFALLK